MTGQALPRLNLSDSFELLTKKPRRDVLMSLWSKGDVAPLPMSDTNRPVEVDLQHNHLPKLEAAGVIEWDREADEIRRGENFDQIAPLLKLMDDHSDELPDDWL